MLRADGATLTAIAARLGVAKSSVSVWVRDVRLPAQVSVRVAPGALRARPLPVWRGDAVRTCARCHHTLPLGAFSRHGHGHQWYCRACFKRYHQALGRRAIEQSNAARERRAAPARAHVFRLLSESACADCGENDVVVLEFDHLGTKLTEVSNMVAGGASVDSLNAEIARCDVVCVNCHRRRTARRAGWFRARPGWRCELARFDPPRARNIRFTYDHLSRCGCHDCGTDDLVVLDFDHEGPKRFSVMRGAWNGLTLARLADEIAVCCVRCANCHRRKTAERGGHRRWTFAQGDGEH